MDKNRQDQNGFNFRTLVLLLFLISFFSLASGQELVNCLVAVVDSVPVSLFDLRVIESFRLLSGFGPDVYQSKEEMVNRYIDQLLVLELAKEQINVSREEIEKELVRLKNQLGSSLFEEKCQSLGLKEADLIPYLKSKLLFEKIIGSRFNQKFYISLKEIEDYYQRVYVPEETARGRTPGELVNVLDEIEARLQNQKMVQQINEWTQELRQRAEILIYFDCLKKAQGKEDR
ncbi:MAG: hypothetical protein H5U06_04745 [Candidatus Aminicenantes bacterium]|nr:hypothetical protein [Candidatus Aminicenantes bacterium]